MNENNELVPRWYKYTSIVFLLWNIMGMLSFFAHTFMSEQAIAELPSDEAELYTQYPLWTTIVFAVAVFGGLIGSIGLVLKKKWSYPALVASLLAVIPQMIHNVFFTQSIEVYGIVQASTMPLLVVLSAIYLVWFSKKGIKNSWLN